jgi:ketosteroid isomerase-like protein
LVAGLITPINGEKAMNQQIEIDSATTRAVAQKWFDGMTSGDPDSAFTCLDQNVEWINYKIVPGYNDVMPWIGTVHGIEAVKKTGVIFLGLVDVQSERLVELVVEGENAMGVIHEQSVVKATGKTFEIEFIQWLKVRNGKIVRWKSYTDPSEIIRPLKGGEPE